LIRRRFAAALIGIFASSVCAPEAHSQTPERADILIVENVRFLHLADRYQQAVQNPSDAGIHPFAPMQILEPDDFLGDRLTPCLRVAIDRRLFFVLKDGSGGLQGAPQLGYHTILRGARMLTDTLEIGAPGGLPLSHPSGGLRQTIPRGTRVARLFEHGGKTYIHPLDGGNLYGWVETPGADAWRQASTLATRPAPLAPALLPRVQTALGEVNAVYGQLYGLLNRQTGRGERVPHWSAAATDSSILCTLENHSRPDAASRSSALLAKRLESLLLGTSLRVTSSAGRVEIRP
jgi:hypothetical protein